MEENQPERKNYLLNTDIQTILGLSYIFAVGIGMLFTYQKYAAFGINIFDYADVFDFLIAPFSDLSIILFTFSSLSIVYALFILEVWWRRKFPKLYSTIYLGIDKKNWFRVYQVLAFTVLAVLYVYSASVIYGRVTVKKIRGAEPINLRYSDNEIKEGIMIGKTKEVVFMLSDSVVSAVPITGLVKEIEIR